MGESGRALDGVRVLDLTHQVAGPSATLALALHQLVDYLFFYPKVAGPWLILIGIATASIASSEPA